MDLAYFNITEQLKTLPIDEVWRRYINNDLRRCGNRWITRCPWHGGPDGDRNPSLVIYTHSNRWHCFGCGQGGSTIDLAMKAFNIDFKEAVQIMAADFGIMIIGSTPEERAEARRKGLFAKAKRELEARFKVKEGEAYQRLASLYRAVDQTLAEIKTEEDLELFGGLYHIATPLEHVLEVLRTGTPAERFAVLGDKQVRRWCGWA
ncbi:DNA primase [Pelotomaculum sp. FP]|nr:DNA primase [Pelotomaculum sp. FP]